MKSFVMRVNLVPTKLQASLDPKSYQKLSIFTISLILVSSLWFFVALGFMTSIIKSSLIISFISAGLCAWLIFNLDRMILVSSSTKWIIQLMRWVMALCTALICSVVIDSFVFSNDIKNTLLEMSETAKQEILDNKYKEFETQNNTLISKLHKIKRECELHEQSFLREIEGSSKTNQIGFGPIAKQKKELLEKARQKLKESENQHSIARSEFNKEVTEIKNEIDKNYENAGILIHIKAMMAFVLSSTESIIFWLVFTLLPLGIEVLPLILKNALTKSAYEYQIEHLEKMKIGRIQTHESVISQHMSELRSESNADRHALRIINR